MSFAASIPPLTSDLLKSSLFSLAAFFLFYRLTKITYNIFLHPLAHIPGPTLAAATYLPEFYYDVLQHGRYTREILKMHSKYGPIVRISPDEVHCNDSEFTDEIYATGSRKREKPLHQVVGSKVIEGSVFSTVSHDHHRLRRAPLAKFFSRSQVSKLEPIIYTSAQRLCQKILTLGEEGPFDVTTAYSLFSTDVISGYCFGESLGLLDQKEWAPNLRGPLMANLSQTYWVRFFPRLFEFIGHATGPIMEFLSEDVALLFKTFKVDMSNHVKKAKSDFNSGIINKETIIFGSLLDPDLPAKEKADKRLTEECMSLLTAGTETVSWTLSVITFYLLSNPEKLQKLTVEIENVVTTPGEVPSWVTLEKLPYLGAVIHEGLRLSYGVASRTSRVAPGEDLVYRGEWIPKGSQKASSVEYVIPRGCAIGMSCVIAHHDEKIFPDSHSFQPERWLDVDKTRRKQLNRAFLTFSKGSRVCIGINLAYCELYIVLALLTVRVFPRMKLWETTEKDVEWDHDIFIPMPVKGSKGVRAVIVS